MEPVKQDSEEFKIPVSVQSSPTPVMDVQPPQPVTPSVITESTAQDVIDQGPQTMAEPPVSTVEETTPEQPETAVQPPQDAAPALAAMAPPVPSKRRNLPIMVLAITVFVTAGIGIFAYLAFSKTATAPASNPSTSPVATQPTATTADVDGTSQSLDESLQSANDTSDFNEGDLSDTTLGL
jgi:hypothetical protein